MHQFNGAQFFIYLKTMTISASKLNPSFPPMDDLIQAVREFDYINTAKQVYSTTITILIYLFIAAQLTWKAMLFLAPHIIKAMQFVAEQLSKLPSPDDVQLVQLQQGTEPVPVTKTRRPTTK